VKWELGKALSASGKQDHALRCFLWSLKKDPFQDQAPPPVKRVGGLEKCWWRNGTPKQFSPNLITLSEKMGFNVERFSKITGSKISSGV
jgi:hypothetical protein